MRKLLFLIPVLLCTFGCRGWYTIIPDIDSVDSVVYINYYKRGSRMVITNHDTIKEIANIINDGDKKCWFFIIATPLFEQGLSFYYKDTIITIDIAGRLLRTDGNKLYELPDNIDNLGRKYFKKPHSKKRPDLL